MGNIRVAPEILNSQGTDIIGYAGDIGEILSSVNTKINESIDVWDGLAQDAYLDMYTNMKDSLDKFPELVNALGEATVSVSTVFSSVDKQLRDGFKSAQRVREIYRYVTNYTTAERLKIMLIFKNKISNFMKITDLSSEIILLELGRVQFRHKQSN